MLSNRSLNWEITSVSDILKVRECCSVGSEEKVSVVFNPASVLGSANTVDSPDLFRFLWDILAASCFCLSLYSSGSAFLMVSFCQRDTILHYSVSNVFVWNIGVFFFQCQTECVIQYIADLLDCFNKVSYFEYSIFFDISCTMLIS